MSSIFKSPKRTAGNKWLETVNPINALSIAEAKAVYDAARRNGSPRLQKIYDEIELTDPVLMTCVERRQSALAGLGWQVKVRASAKDAALADAQREAAERFFAGIDNLTDALCHLDLAFFRGFAHVQPIWEEQVKVKGEGEQWRDKNPPVQPSTSNLQPTVRHINLLDNWNFLKGEGGEWLWNPDCSTDPRECEPITPEARLVSVCRRRAIDWPALAVYIRKSLGERDWGRFIERYGIPPVDVVMAPNATEEQRNDYLASAESARDGLPTAWPAQSVVTRAEGSRGQDPFTAFVEHQEKLIVLAATGGTLTSLAQADTGSLAGGAQMDVWREIVLRDALVIADAVERSLLRPFIAAAFPGEELAVSFEMGVERVPTAKEAADLAGAVRAAGYVVERTQLEEATGLRLEREEQAQGAGFGVQGLARARGKEVKGEGEGEGEGEQRKIQPLLAAFAADNKPLADALQDLLQQVESCRLKVEGSAPNSQHSTPNIQPILADFLAKLPSLVPDDPATAAVIAEEMARAFGAKEEVKSKSEKVADGEITQEEAERIYEEMMSK